MNMSPQSSSDAWPALMSCARAAQYLDVSRAHVYRLIGDGALHPVHTRGAMRLARQDLDRYVEQLLQDQQVSTQ